MDPTQSQYSDGLNNTVTSQPTTTVQSHNDSQLPFTGSDILPLAIVAVFLCLCGVFIKGLNRLS